MANLHTSERKRKEQLFIKTCVCCNTVIGPDIFFVKVECTREQYTNGEHYEVARGWVEENYEVEGPFWLCDENDPGNAVLNLFKDWGSATIVGDGKI